MLAQKALSNQISQSTPTIPGRSTRHGSSLSVSPYDSDGDPVMMKGRRPIPPSTTRSHAQAVLSPRTTRRNMLATELTESLRRHLLWERIKKSSTANAVLKRRYTSHDVARQHPEKLCIKQSENTDDRQYWWDLGRNDYNEKGW